MKNKKMAKKTLIALVIALLAVGSYFEVWLESYNQSKAYYQKAVQLFNQGHYVEALKGTLQGSQTDNGKYSGGFQQVMEVWENPYAQPKPGLYQESRQLIQTIIQQKLTIAQGEEMFKDYFGLDNRYLGQVMLHVGDLYKAKGDKRDAKTAYQTVQQAFPLDSQLKKESQAKLKQLTP